MQSLGYPGAGGGSTAGLTPGWVSAVPGARSSGGRQGPGHAAAAGDPLVAQAQAVTLSPGGVTAGLAYLKLLWFCAGTQAETLPQGKER